MRNGLHKILLAGLMILQIVSCDSLFAPAPVEPPIFRSISAEVENDGFTLTAELDPWEETGLTFGFDLGQNKAKLKRTDEAFPIRTGFKKKYDSQGYDKKYYFRAFVSNGHNVIYSEIDSLVTDTMPQLPSPQLPSEPQLPSGQNPDEIQIRYEMDISHSWRSLDFRISDITIHEGGAYVENISYSLSSVHSYRGVSFFENTSTKARSVVLKMKGEGQEYYIKVIQHSYLDNIEFECPKVKSLCVSRWDANGDGEVSYYEAEVIEGYFKNEDMVGREITSFKEYMCFRNLSFLDNNLFEGSSLKSIYLCDNEGHAWRRMFKDCHNLEFVTTTWLHVEEEAFMNCTSLKDVHACIRGARAYMGCTALETAVQHYLGLPDMTFKGCSNLHTFNFEIEGSSVFDSTSIGVEAFHGCSSLRNITIPRDILQIEDRAFYGCSSLENIYLDTPIPPTLGSEVFSGCSPDLKIYVPDALVDIYKSNWPDLSEKIQASNSL